MAGCAGDRAAGRCHGVRSRGRHTAYGTAGLEQLPTQELAPADVPVPEPVPTAGADPGVDGVPLVAPEIECARSPCAVVPPPDPPLALATARRATVRVLTATASRRATGEGGVERGTVTATVAEPLATCGHPRKATIAVASTNRTAAPATSEPELPKPARYP